MPKMQWLLQRLLVQFIIATIIVHALPQPTGGRTGKPLKKNREDILRLAKSISFADRGVSSTPISADGEVSPPAAVAFSSSSMACPIITQTDLISKVQRVAVEGIRATLVHRNSSSLRRLGRRLSDLVCDESEFADSGSETSGDNESDSETGSEGKVEWRRVVDPWMLKYFKKQSRGGMQPVDFAEDRVFTVRTPLKRGRITFHSIAPEIYSRLRERWGISTKDYLRSLKHPMAAIGPLKSGAYFFYTQDNRFIIKFIPALHAKVCWQKLPAYFKHSMVQNTLLSRILGLHKIHVYDPRASVNDVYHVLVIANTFPDPPDFVYDLKGSRHNRLARVDGAATALKDQDWLNDGRQLRLGHFAKEIFISQLQQDTQWIRQAQVNDYSLLVGVRLVDSRLIDRTLAAKQLRDLEPRAQTNSDNAWYQYDGGFIARTDNGEVYIDEEGRAVIYYFSLIDLYTVYDSARQEEHRRKAKTPELALAISCVPPSKYYERFIDALRRWSI